ncbi:MAG: hypothetical protein GX053_14755 [Tissierella sp.]|nr:hypothetical protein [Tissierella sp.]
MKREDFSEWYPITNSDKIYDIEGIENINGLDIWLVPDGLKEDLNSTHKVLIHFDSYQSYTSIEESYSEGFWINSPEKAWTFYKSNTSHYIEVLRNSSVIFKESIKDAVHYVIVGTNSIFHIISEQEPAISLRQT